MNAETKSSNVSSPGEGFPARRRVKSQGDFDRVFKRGKVAADRVLVIHGIRRSGNREDSESSLPGSQRNTRLGLSVSKKVGSAPIRNRWKRLIREAFRRQLEQLPESMDIIVRPKRGAKPSLPEIRKSLLRLAKKIEHKV